MTEISLAWLLTKVTAPVVGATKLHHVKDAAQATNLHLTEEACAYLEEPYLPHKLVGLWRRIQRLPPKKNMSGPLGNKKSKK